MSAGYPNTFIPVVQPAIPAMRQVYSILKVNKTLPLAFWGVAEKRKKKPQNPHKNKYKEEGDVIT